MIAKQVNLFFIALGFLTRIPVPANIDFNQNNLNQASRYFSLIGLIIGIFGALIYLMADYFLPQTSAVIFSMLFTVILTGCFHEDGLADTCDGFGGGWQAEQKLQIMKDSRIGTYGAAGLWFALTIKFTLLSSLSNVVLAVIVAHALSRCVSTVMIFLLPYVSESATSKVKPLAETQQKTDLFINLAIGVSTLLLVPANALSLIITLIIAIALLRHLFIKQIKGFTGDTLGATQQISEILIYLVLLTAEIPI